ncbi:MAG: BatA domain-containing protein [Candidatus Marinimicrobia bacterium]|jgi:hypothetical protein|nr:BatA domain-containing protein [Candidatus Neomarinimicrobiota bacterium]
MAFLFPNILWGLLAASLPLVIHLISLRRTKTVAFSSIQHIKALEHNAIKKLKIMQWILIALRMTIIAALVLMVSGPIQVNDAAWVPSEKESVAVMIIDNSASMAVTKDRDSFLDQAKSEIPDILSSFTGLVHLRVMQTSPPKEIYSGTIEPGDQIHPDRWPIKQSASQDDLWAVVDETLSNTNANMPNRECFILSDFPSSPPSSIKESFPEWRFYGFGRAPLVDNVSVNELVALSQIKLPNHLLKLNTKIENMGSVERRNVPVELYLNDERVGQIVSHFQPGRLKDFLFQVYPGKSGIVRGKLELPHDHFSLDDRQTFELTIPEQISCKVIASSQSDLFMLRTVLESINGQDRFLDLELKVLPQIERIYLEETDVLILQDPKSFTPSAIESIKRFLNRGGSILWFAGTNYPSLESVTFSNLQLPTMGEQIMLDGSSYFSVRIDDRDNPLLQELNLRDLEEALPQVYGYNQVSPKQGHKQILSLNNDDPFLMEIPFGGSPIYLFTSPLDLRWNDFSMKGLLIPMIHRLLILSATDELNTGMVVVDAPKTIRIPKELINQKWAIETPSGNRILVVPDYNEGAIVFDQTNELGSYEVYAGSEFFTAFSTRLSPYESPKLRASTNEIFQAVGADRMVWLSPGTPIKETIESQRHGRTLWRTFLIIALALFMIESYLSRPKRDGMKTKV